jgi:hypothetical protein
MTIAPKHINLLSAALLLLAIGISGYLYMQKRHAEPAPQPAPVVAAAPAPAPAPKPDAPLDDKSKKILELFNPTDAMLTKQISETQVIQNIEQILTTAYVLTTCKHIDQRAFIDNYIAVINYAQHMNLASNPQAAEARVKQIAEGAGASYSLVYSRTKCDRDDLPGIATKLLAWQKAYATPPAP